MKIGFWNVNGWSKNTFSDNFNVRLNSISCLNLDVLGIAETHLKKDEVLIVNDFKWFGHNRNGIHKNAKCGSGGVGFLIKDYLTEIFDIGILDQSFEGIYGCTCITGCQILDLIYVFAIFHLITLLGK